MENNNIEKKLKPLEGFLLSIKRNTIKGWYELEVGLIKDWVFKSNKIIECEVLDKTSSGILVKIFPKKNNVYIDDLISFVELIIETNSKIAEKEKEFTLQMDKVKKNLEQEAEKFYKELDELREKSFDKFNSEKKSLEKNNPSKESDKNTTNSTKKRGRPPKKIKENEQKENKE